MCANSADSDIFSILQLPQAAIMGIVNVTPDSFSDGGRFKDVTHAFDHAMRLVEEGADILDIGGESTRPGAETISAQQESDRVLPLIELIRSESQIPLSIDTNKLMVMRNAVNAGADMINDVNGLQAVGAVEYVAQVDIPVCVMHKQGTPKTMQTNPEYVDVVAQVLAFFNARVKTCLAAGIERSKLFLDPGIGFGKTLQHNLMLLQAIADFRSKTRCEILIGVSRKSLIGELLGRNVDERLPASLGLAVQAVLNGAKIVRVHDVRPTFDAVRSAEAVANAHLNNN